ncbi:MAG: FtsX-like permease family protein [Candidatus Latescibacteria bacterium]|nr:FtsX-like permease family protein [Candidatus Latescibacterota bacterium]
MIILESISIALQQLWANKLRSSLTLLGLLIGVGAVVGIVSISEGMRQTVIGEFAKMSGASQITVEARAWIYKDGRWVRSPHYRPLRLEDLDYLRDISPQLEMALPLLSTGGQARYGKASTNSPIEATTPDYPYVHNWKIAEGRFFQPRDLEQQHSVCVLGQQAREDLFGRHSPLGQEVKLNGDRYLVIGVMEERKVFGFERGNQVFVPVTTAQRRMIGNRDLGGATLLAQSPDDVPQLIPLIESALKKRYGQETVYEIQSSKSFLDQIEQSILVMKMVTGGIAGISLLVGGIGIMNIMLVSVTERTREIGIRKALGAKPATLLTQFVVEAVVLSLVGGLIGVGMGIGLGVGISLFIEHFAESPFPSVVAPDSVVVSLIISVVIGLFFGIYPAARAARLDPVVALGSE